MAAWAKAYEAHKDGIRSVKMTQNGIRPEGISLLIGSGLRHCSHLELLDMQDNTFTFKGAAALAAALAHGHNSVKSELETISWERAAPSKFLKPLQKAKTKPWKLSDCNIMISTPRVSRPSSLRRKI